MTRTSIHRRATLAGAVLLSLAACRVADLSAPTRILAPEAAASNRGDAARWRDHRSPALIGCQAGDALTASAQIGPQGGVLRFGGSRLVVPPGALRTSVRITATPRGDANGTVDFQPEGLRFHKPVGLVLSVSGCDAPADGVPSVVYLGEQGEILETIAASFDRRWNEVAAPITHFSGYAIAF
jgi:hypothetical protein